MNIGNKVILKRNGEVCTISEIIEREGNFQTCGTNFKTYTVKPSTVYVLKFDDGDITLASKYEI